MPFINEKISDIDRRKYAISEINLRENVSDYSPEWTRDKDRDIYLRWMNSEREQPGRQNFTFYWKGTLFHVVLKKEGEGVKGGKGWNKWSVWAFSNRKDLPIPPAIEQHRDDVVAALKEALTAYKDFGINSWVVEHTAYFDF